MAMYEKIIKNNQA